MPRPLSDEVHAQFRGDAELAVVSGAYHENGWTRPTWSRSIVDFIERRLGENDLHGRG